MPPPAARGVKAAGGPSSSALAGLVGGTSGAGDATPLSVPSGGTGAGGAHHLHIDLPDKSSLAASIATLLLSLPALGKAGREGGVPGLTRCCMASASCVGGVVLAGTSRNLATPVACCQGTRMEATALPL